MKIAITGGNGFIAKNLFVRLKELKDVEVAIICRDTSIEERNETILAADFIFHLAGVNRPKDTQEYQVGNVDLTREICDVLFNAGRNTSILVSSSSQAESDNDYGSSKLKAENEVRNYGLKTKAAVYICRLPNVFGKWSRPNYNSVVATFCHNISRNIPIVVNDPAAILRLVYIDDVVDIFLGVLSGNLPETEFLDVSPVYETTVGNVAKILKKLAESRYTLTTPPVGLGLMRALHSTYLSHLPPASFAYEVPKHSDSRGVFVEMLKTETSGQFSYFTAFPGITRGGHYHHTKTEKFLVIQGKAHFKFRHIVTNEINEIITTGHEALIVETVPGWAHDITNIGEELMIVLLWANEIFDRENPDTIGSKVIL